MTKTKHRGGLLPTQYLTEEEVQKLRAHCDEQVKTGSRRAMTDQIIVEILCGSGLRPAEVVALNLEDLPAHHSKLVLSVRHGKGDVSRAVVIPQSLAVLIAEYESIWRAGAGPGDPLIMGRTGNRMSYRNLACKMAKISRACGITYNARCLRHTYAMRLYAIEKDLLAVQAQLGHSSPNTTVLYAQTTSEAMMRQVEQLA
jgi:integrase/recombinase XerC